MITKAFEIRDKGTFIPVLATKMVPADGVDYEIERYLLRRAGHGFDFPSIVLCRMEASGVDRNATYDPYSWYSWGGGSRTMTVAHSHIEKNFDALKSGDVIDVEFILNETKVPKTSERFYR